MATTTVDQGTDLLWRSYAKQVTAKLSGGGGLGDRNAVFICPLTTQGVASGEHIPVEVTNNQLYRAVDSLLDPKSPVYVPGEGSYFNTVSSYLKHVFLNKNPSNEAIIRFTSAQKEATFAEEAYYAQLEKAAARYQAAVGSPSPDPATLERWAATNLPGLARKKEAMQSAEGTVTQIQSEINGPAAGDLNKQIAAVNRAGDMYTSYAGLNMPCVGQDVNNIDANRSGSAAPPKDVFYRPLYTLQGFTSQVDDWIKMPATTVADTITFSISGGRSTKWSDMGFQNVGAQANISAWYFLRASGSASSTTASSNLSLSASGSSVEVTITFKGLKALPLGIGAWDVPDLRHLYPNLAPGTPPNLMGNHVRAERILVGYAPGMKVKFDAATFKQAQSMFSTASHAGGSVSLFGFAIGGSASASAHSTGSTSFKDVKIDAESFTISIPPISSTYPCLVGVLAKKI